MGRKAKVKRARLWKVSGDSPIWAIVPPFTGEHNILLNLNEETDAVDYFGALMTSEILLMIVRESNLYAMKKWL